MTDGKKKPLVVGLHENVSQFFSDFHKKYSAEMQCGRGCSKCCVGGLSVFPVEAQVIVDWINGLDSAQRQELKAQWQTKQNDSNKKKTQKCVFLHEDLCTIYPVRPTVCRSQGLPMKVASSSPQDSDNQTQIELSLCELNFTNEEKLPAPAEWLDLDRLNTLLSIAQNFAEKSEQISGIESVKEVSSGRVTLSNLQSLLLQKLS